MPGAVTLYPGLLNPCSGLLTYYSGSNTEMEEGSVFDECDIEVFAQKNSLMRPRFGQLASVAASTQALITLGTHPLLKLLTLCSGTAHLRSVTFFLFSCRVIFVNF
jgi:hypothetical protein